MSNLIRKMIFSDVNKEIERARSLYPSNELLSLAVTEEVGETIQAAIDHHFGKDTVNHIYEEAVQAITVLVRFIEEGSKDLKFQGICRENSGLEYQFKDCYE